MVVSKMMVCTLDCPRHGVTEVRARHGDMVRCPYCAVEAKIAERDAADEDLAQECEDLAIIMQRLEERHCECGAAGSGEGHTDWCAAAPHFNIQEPTTPPVTPAQREASEAIIRAAEDWFERWENTPGPYLCPFGERLAESVRALHKSRRPQPVKPESVEPGTRFRFASATIRPSGLYLIYAGPNDFPVWRKGFEILTFHPDDRIIPITD